MVITVLDPTDGAGREARHQARVDATLGPHLARTRAREPHPVEDFLFRYYALRPGALRRWHPGHGIVLTGPVADRQLELTGYHRTEAGVTVSTDLVRARRPLIGSLHRLLTATANRPAHVGCFGLHEWAMVYRQDPEEVRHARWPLRLGGDGTDQVVEGHRIACTHFDAFRFFTPPARPLNVLRPQHDDRSDFEQPGCLHAGMDLYKHAGRLLPLVSSELVMDCFDLAREIRVLDMRASPYDFRALGYDPVPIETAAGKQAYAAAQRDFAARAAPLRQRLIEACSRLRPDRSEAERPTAGVGRGPVLLPHRPSGGQGGEAVHP